MRRASTGEKTSQIRASSHDPDTGSISSSTWESMIAPFGVITFLLGLEGIHGSFHILTFEPVSTLQMHPLLKVWMPETMLCQVYTTKKRHICDILGRTK